MLETPKPKKNNIHDDFERIYMRFNDVKRFMHQADLTVGETKDFKAAIEYLVRIYQMNERYRIFFSRHGFEADDLRSVAQVFAYTFVGRQTALGLNPRDYRLMIRYVGQRMSRLLNWTAKKFYSDEVPVTVGLGNFMDEDSYSGIGSLAPGRVEKASYAAWKDQETEDTTTDHERLHNMKQDLEEMKEQLKKLDSSSQEFRPLRTAAKKLASEERQLRRKLAAELIQQKIVSEKLRSKLQSNPEKYREQLCYYATTKSVSAGVRSAARLLCNRNGFDYKAWVKSKIADGELFGAEFSY